MATRVRRTAAQIAADLRARANVAEAKAKKVERAQQTRTAIIVGETVRGMVNAGDAEAKRIWDRVVASLTRKQDRLAFGLKPLPEARPDDNQPVNPPVLAVPPVVQPVPAASPPAGQVHPEDRLKRALAAWNASEKMPQAEREPLRIELGQAIAGVERVSRMLWKELPATDRRYYGLSDRPGEMLR